MKSIKFTLIIALAFGFANTSEAQNLNWASLKQEQRHILNVHGAFDYGFAYGIGYGYHFRMKLPLVLNVEHSQPAGPKVFDDVKTKVGGQIRLFQAGDFHLSAKMYGVFRRFENNLARMVNFGSDMSGTIGFYKTSWYVAGEFGFDKAIVSHFKHSEVFKESFPGVKDGWYVPPTGGNYYYGLQAGFSFRKSDITVSAGRIKTEDLKGRPMIPYYAKLGYNFRF